MHKGAFCQILADQKAPPAGGGAPHYYVPPQIFRLWTMPEVETNITDLSVFISCVLRFQNIVRCGLYWQKMKSANNKVNGAAKSFSCIYCNENTSNELTCAPDVRLLQFYCSDLEKVHLPVFQTSFQQNHMLD